MAIRAVLFDFGGVLYKTPDRGWMKKWQRLLGLGKDEVISSIILSQDDSPYMQAIMEGQDPRKRNLGANGQTLAVKPASGAVDKTQLDEPAQVK